MNQLRAALAVTQTRRVKLLMLRRLAACQRQSQHTSQIVRVTRRRVRLTRLCGRRACDLRNARHRAEAVHAVLCFGPGRLMPRRRRYLLPLRKTSPKRRSRVSASAFVAGRCESRRVCTAMSTTSKMKDLCMCLGRYGEKGRQRKSRIQRKDRKPVLHIVYVQSNKDKYNRHRCREKDVRRKDCAADEVL